MIDATVNEMENRFKADLNGWLEHVSKHPSPDRLRRDSEFHSNPIINSFKQTMEYYEHEKETAQEALHNVIFHALTKREDFDVDFNVPRFEEGITYKDFSDLIQEYQLFVYTRRELWKMDTESALIFLYRLYSTSHGPKPEFRKMHIQLALEIEDNEQCESWMQRLTQQEVIVDLHSLYSLMTFIHELMDNTFQASRCQPVSQRRVERLLDILEMLISSSQSHILDQLGLKERRLTRRRIYNALYAIIELAKENGYDKTYFIEKWYRYFTHENGPLRDIDFSVDDISNQLISNKSARTPLTLQEFAQRNHSNSDETDHEQTFRIIVAYITQTSISNQIDQHSTISSGEEAGFDRLEQVVRDKSPRYQFVGVKFNCIYIIRRRTMYWKSILKVIIQFLDLWISDIQDAKCVDIFASLIARENMMPVLYKHILKHVQHYHLDDNSTTVEMIKNISMLMEKCLEHVETNQQLLLFRDHVFNTRDVNEDVRLPILGSSSFWNIPFNQEVIKVTNQITSFEEEDVQVPEDIIRKLIILSVIWPYGVVKQLFLSCIQNKNQYKAIVPVLHSLGNLCILTTRQCQDDTLLVLVLQEIISLQYIKLVDTYMGNISQFIKSCCRDQKELKQEIPLILTPNSLVDQNPFQLLNLKQVLNKIVLRNLASFTHHYQEENVTLIRFSLYLLNALCDDESTVNDWTAPVAMTKSDLPAVLYCSPETILVCLTEIVARRDLYEERLLHLLDWESALNFINKFSVIIQYALQTKPEEFPLINQFFSVTLSQDSWKKQLLWYDITRGMTNKKAIKVPNAFFRITGALDDLFVDDEKVLQTTSTTAALTTSKQGWYELFTACKLSTRLTDDLFEHTDQWMYNLLLLWKHPNEDTIIQSGFEHVLHPHTSLSVSIEYPNLLVHFLEKLYDSFTGAHQVIKEYNGYEREDMRPIIQDLTEKGTKQYFIVLYITRLLKNNIKKEQRGKDDDYYISSLIKVLQGLTNWVNISNSRPSYNELKRTNIYPDNINPKYVNTFSGTQSILDKEIFYYPILNSAQISDRALSILALAHLSLIFNDSSFKDETQVIQTLMLQIMEGFIDMPSRQNFKRMLQQQPKSRIVNWKKKKSDKKFVMMIRPILTSIEENLLKPTLDNVPNSNRVLQALGLTPSHKQESKLEHLYFL